MMNYSIAVIDDDTVMLDMITEVLEDNLEVSVLGFNRSEMARDFLLKPEGHNLSLIISDLNMPRYDGLQLLRDCRACGLKAPFILLTGDATKETVLAARKSGATQFLAKPFSTDDLISKVKPLLG